jgi:CBS domain-containing protein
MSRVVAPSSFVPVTLAGANSAEDLKSAQKDLLVSSWQDFFFPLSLHRVYTPRNCGAHFAGGDMATIRDLLAHRTIHYIQPQQTVREAAKYMVDCNVGAAPVLDGTKLVGIFSERDIMAKVIIQGLNPDSTHIADVMSTTLRTVTSDSSCDEAMLMMQTHGVRHLPVCDGSTLVGFLSLRDLMRHTLEEKVGEADMMRAYIQTSIS